MTEVDYYLALLTNFGYNISRQAVERIVNKFKAEPDAQPIGGPENFIKAWMNEEKEE